MPLLLFVVACASLAAPHPCQAQEPKVRKLEIRDPNETYYLGQEFAVQGKQQWQVYVPEGRKLMASCGLIPLGAPLRDLIAKPLSQFALEPGESELAIDWKSYLPTGPEFAWRVKNLRTERETRAIVVFPKEYVDHLKINVGRAEFYFAPAGTARVPPRRETYLFRYTQHPELQVKDYPNPKDLPLHFEIILHDKREN